MPAPLIETPRLRLRPHRPADLPDCAAMWADPAVTRFISGRAFTREEVWARLLRYTGHWEWMQYGFWAIELKDTGAFAGELGFADFQREIVPPLDLPEAGWVLHPSFHRQGIAAEALAAALAWAGRRFPATACLIHPDNLPSIRLAQRFGYLESARAAYKDQPTIVFRRGYEPMLSITG